VTGEGPWHFFREGIELELVASDASSLALAMRVRESQLNLVGVVHGGAVFTLLDSAAGFLVARTCGEGESPVSVSVTTTNVAPLRPEDERVIGRASIVHRGRTVVHVEGEARTQAGRTVARALAVFYVRGTRT
jgi:acyl-CoA thioesterase